jgi:ABC-2 type transport system ATP-binding protein
MIITEDLSKHYEDICAVDGVNLAVQAGEVFALLGPNGAGKTTTVRMLSSILQPTRGWARVAGFDVVEQPDKVRAAVGVLTEQHGLYMRMPALEYLDFFGQLYGLDLPTRQNRASRLLEDFGLWDHRNRRIGQYSRGMKQKLALARVMLHEPPVLLLDEPTSSMDPESAMLVRDAIQDLRSADRAILLCTHNLDEAEKLADQIAIIRHGRIISQGSPKELKQRLLGPSEYEIRFVDAHRDIDWCLPDGIEISSRGQDWLRYRAQVAAEVNPLILQKLLDQGLPVISLQEVPRSLEQVYLEVMNGVDEYEKVDVQ